MRAEHATLALHGLYRDRLYNHSGMLIWDYGWRKNVILTDCRRLLAGFMLGTADTLGIRELRVGIGLETWDDTGPPPPTPEDELADPNPFVIPQSQLEIDFLEPTSDATSLVPTNRIQVHATLGPGMPTWPDATHPTSTLREFSLVAQLNGALIPVNLVRHPGIAKDPASTLERTIWLVF